MLPAVSGEIALGHDSFDTHSPLGSVVHSVGTPVIMRSSADLIGEGRLIS